MRIIPVFLLFLSLVSPGLAVAAYSATDPKLAMLDVRERPKKILLLPPQMFVAEISAGGVIQKQDDWTRQASENLLVATENMARSNGSFEVIRLPALAAEEADTVESHIGLYDRVASAIYIYGQGKDPGWQQKKIEWDYTLGNGLAFLRDKTGADSALIYVGADIISTGGRKAAFTVGLLLGIAIPLGQSFITVGLADLKTGEIRWMSYDQSAFLDSREADEVEKLVGDFFKTFPLQ